MHLHFKEGEYQISSKVTSEVKFRTKSMIHSASEFVGKFLCPDDISAWMQKPSSTEEMIPGVVTVSCMTKSEYGLRYPEQFRQNFPVDPSEVQFEDPLTGELLVRVTANNNLYDHKSEKVNYGRYQLLISVKSLIT